MKIWSNELMLAVEGNLAKSEQLTLSRKYKAYQDAFDKTISLYNSYLETLNSIIQDDGASHVWTEYERNNFSAQEVALVTGYYNAFKEGRDFFMALMSNVQRHAMTRKLTFNENLVCLKVYFADKALNDLFVGGATLAGSQAVGEYREVLDYETKADAYTDEDVLTMTSLRTFVDDASTLDMYLLVSDYMSYLDKLSSDGKVKAIRAYTFIQNNILA